MFNLPQKQQIHTGKREVPDKQEPALESPARPATEESGELKEFVDNYLTLADKALGFMRRPGNNDLTISTCCYCQHTIASTNLKLLAFAENLHVCPVKPSHASADDDAA